MEGITPKNSSLAIIVCTRLLAVINSVYAEWMDGWIWVNYAFPVITGSFPGIPVKTTYDRNRNGFFEVGFETLNNDLKELFKFLHIHISNLNDRKFNLSQGMIFFRIESVLNPLLRHLTLLSQPPSRPSYPTSSS